jgi:FkbM family methyltransferase
MTLLEHLKRSMYRILSRLGLAVQRHERYMLAGYANTYGPIDIVIDVGVADGTPEIYEAAPTAYLYLVEPLDLYETHIRSILKSRRGEWIRVAAGERNSTGDFVICNDPRKSGLEPRPSSDLSGATTKLVQIRPLDDILFERLPRQSAVFLKVDVEGNELAVLRGAEHVVRKSRLVYVECTLYAARNGYTMTDLVEFMSEHGHTAIDILTVGRRDGVAQHANMLFANRDFAGR